MKALWTAICLSVLSLPAMAADAARTLAPYSADYSVEYDGMTLGEGSISLAPQGEKGCYRFESQTDPMFIVKMTYGAPYEVSLFCMEGGQLRARHFEYQLKKKHKDNFTQDFDWTAKQVRILKNGELTQRELPPEGAYDRFVIQQAVRMWAAEHAGDANPEPRDFVMIEDDRVATYRFAIKGRETVETPAGRFETLKVERIDNPNKSMHSWLALDRDYLPVKIERVEKGKTKLRMLLLK